MKTEKNYTIKISGKNPWNYFSDEIYYKTEEEMKEAYKKFLADENINYIEIIAHEIYWKK